MRRAFEHRLTDEDIQLIEAHHLGACLNIYKIWLGAIYFLRGFGCLVFGIGIISAVIVIPLHFIGAPTEQLINNFFFISLLFQEAFCLLLGWWCLRIAIPQYRKKHLVICEQGFLQVEDTRLIRRVEIVYWPDIRSVKKLILGYVIAYREHETCSLDILYQNVGELAELIKQRSGLV